MSTPKVISPGPSGTELCQLRDDYGVNRATFARMLGVAEATLAEWEESRPDAPGLRKIKQVEGILKGLARVMQKDFIATWLQSPNDACAELGSRTPVDLMERGDYEALEDMIFYFESGVPY